MTQGTRVTQNLLYDNGPSEDLFLEVNHGPCLVDNNILLSPSSLLVNSQGAAYAHNLMAGRIHVINTEKRLTPHLQAHGTAVVGLSENLSGDERFYNNMFISKLNTRDMREYDKVKLPVWMEGNVYFSGAQPCNVEADPVVLNDYDPGLKLIKKNDGIYLELNLNIEQIAAKKRQLVTTELLGKAKTPDLPYVQPDDTPYRIETDYLGKKRNTANPFPGPFATPASGLQSIKVWPMKHSE
jgi:alpha-N-arabinofuranosidase